MQVAIHAGALFTDEGRLEKLLQTNARALRQNGARYWGFRAYKNIFRPALGAVSDRPVAEDTRAKFRHLMPPRRPLRRAILASAEYIGEQAAVIMDGQFYPQAGRRMAHLDQVFDDATVELFVGLRNPGSFIPKVLMSLSAPERQHILGSTDLSCLSWLAMIEDIRDLAPDVNITLWSNEEIPLLCGDIACALAGLPADTPLDGEFTLLSSLVSKAGQDELDNLTKQDLSRNDASLRDGLAAIFRQHALPDAIEEEVELPGWNDDVVAAFTELYEQDLARLQTMPDIRFLKP